MQADNDKDKNLELTKLPIIQQACNLNRDFYIRPPSEPILLLGALSNCIVKVIKPLYGIPKLGKHKFTTHHPYYKEKLGMTEYAYNPYLLYSDKLVSNPTWTSVCVASYLCFGYNLGRLGNFSMPFLFACGGSSCTTKSGLVTKEGEPTRTSLHLISHLFQSLSFLLGSTLSKMRPVMFICLAISKYITMCKWLFSSVMILTFLMMLITFILIPHYSQHIFV